MVTVSHEVSAYTQARLRGVFRRSSITWLPGFWAFVEQDRASDLAGSIAEIHDEGHLSALCPAAAATERFGVFRVVLPRGVDDSGFVGWLTSRVKADTGSGLFVICGQNQRQGGIFDYYGVPEAAVGAVRILLNRLRTAGTLDGAIMGVVESAANANISRDTVFCFDQNGSALTASYGGGPVADGWLAGTVDSAGALVRFRFLQVGIDGVVDSGQSTADIYQLPDGRWRLTEHFSWTSRDGEGINRLEEIATRS